MVTNEIKNSPTFELVNNDVSTFAADIQGKISADYRTSECKLPVLYATAKMHKSPKSFRFITSSRDTITSNVSKYVSKCLKLLLNTARSSFEYRIREIDNCVFVIDNRNKVVNFMDLSNINKVKHKSVSTWDFSTLYTKIPHDKLKEKLKKFVEKMFCIKKDKNFICFSKTGKSTYFSINRSKANLSFSSCELIKWIDFIVDNSYICYKGEVYRQAIGIPMGTNSAPFMANLFLHLYEYEYIEHLISSGEIQAAQDLSNIYRYQDDCISFNDNGSFAMHYNKIYPPEMVLDCTNLSTSVCTFLDLRISVYRGRFLYKSFDKRKNFNFEVVKYPNLDGNIPYAPSYGVFISQLVRFCDINQSANNFVSDVKDLTETFVRQGFDFVRLRDRYFIFCSKYLYRWAKFGTDIASSKVVHKIFPYKIS